MATPRNGRSLLPPATARRYAYTTVSTLAIIGMLTLYGYITSRAGEPVFSRLIDDPAEA